MKVSLFLIAAGQAILATHVSAAVLFSENFEGLTLGPYISPTESGGDGTDWTSTPPAGWVRDQSTTPVGIPTEFYGWTFHDRISWINTEAGQSRNIWTGGQGTIMVADPDAYDDGTEIDSELYNVSILTPAISLSGVVANSVKIAFESSFRAEDSQTALLDVTFNGGGTFSNLLTYDSTTLIDGQLLNDPISLLTSNPASGNVQFRFSLRTAGNDWWWAVDNIVVTGDLIDSSVPEAATWPGLLLLLVWARVWRKRCVG